MIFALSAMTSNLLNVACLALFFGCLYADEKKVQVTSVTKDNLHLPFVHKLNKPLGDGDRIVIAGVPTKKSTGFELHLQRDCCEISDTELPTYQCTSCDNLMLQVKVKFGGKNEIELKAKEEGKWMDEMRKASFPYNRGEPYELSLQVGKDSFSLLVNGKSAVDFPHQMDVELANYITFTGMSSLAEFKIYTAERPDSRLLPLVTMHDEKMPFTHNLRKRLTPGDKIVIRGKPKPKSTHFCLDLKKDCCADGKDQCAPCGDVVLTLSFRFKKQSTVRKIVLNSKKNNKWLKEKKTASFPLEQGKPYEISLQVGEVGFSLFVNGTFITSFKHRLNLETANFVTFEGMTSLNEFTVYTGFQPQLKQWVNSIQDFSSEYNKDGWAASQVIGKPDVYPRFGDLEKAWAPKKKYSTQYITLEYKKKVFVEGVNIFETYNGGAVVAVEAKDPLGQWATLWMGMAENFNKSRIFSPPLKLLNIKTQTIRLLLDLSENWHFVEIDAVELIGSEEPPCFPPAVKQWVKEVQTPELPKEYKVNSSVVKFTGKVVGKPRRYPNHGHNVKTRALKNITLEYEDKVYVQRVNIYETHNAGAVVALEAKDSSGEWVTLWTGKPENVKKSRIFSPPLKQLNVLTNTLRLKLDISVAHGWAEIDAVELFGFKQKQCSRVQKDQWVASVKSFTTQFDDDSWSANQVVGEPDIYPRHGDLKMTWALQKKPVQQNITLKYKYNVYVKSVNVYETYNGGAVVAMAAKDPAGEWVTLWKGEPQKIAEESRIFSPQIAGEVKTKTVRLHLDQSLAEDYVEIDAVELSGSEHIPCSPPLVTQWVKSVKAYSSAYKDKRWGAHQIVGKTRVYPSYGDYEKTWAPMKTPRKQNITLEYQNEVFVERVNIFETYNGGAVVALEAENSGGQWIELWTATGGPKKITKSRMFSPPLKPLTVKTKMIRLHLDMSAADGGWVKIDAVQLLGYRQPIQKPICD